MGYLTEKRIEELRKAINEIRAIDYEPEDEIGDSLEKVILCAERYIEVASIAVMINGNVQTADLRNKYVFWDIDGTLAPYRFNGHVSDPDGTDNGMSLEEIEEDVFLLRAPSQHMQRVIKTCEAKEHIVIGHCQVDKEKMQKEIWLNTHYSMIKERLLVFEDESKADTILQYCTEHNIDLKDVVFVDDRIPLLQEAERKGIKSYHISSFLDWEYQDGFAFSGSMFLNLEEPNR